MLAADLSAPGKKTGAENEQRKRKRQHPAAENKEPAEKYVSRTGHLFDAPFQFFYIHVLGHSSPCHSLILN